MAEQESSHLRLQQQVDCQLETKARTALEAWEISGWNESSSSG